MFRVIFYYTPHKGSYYMGHESKGQCSLTLFNTSAVDI